MLVPISGADFILDYDGSEIDELAEIHQINLQYIQVDAPNHEKKTKIQQ